MNKKSVILSCLLIPLSLDSFATMIHHGKLITHKEWTTGGATLMMMPGVEAYTNLATLNARKARFGKFDSIISDSYAGLQKIKGVGKPSRVNAYNTFYVDNSTDIAQQYSYSLGVCADIDASRTRCGYVTEMIELQPGGYFYSDEQPQLSVRFAQPGKYNTYASIDIYSNGLNHHASASGVIEIS